MIALYFRFSLIDSNFNIYINNKKIGVNDLSELTNKTQFLWEINSKQNHSNDELLNILKKSVKKRDEIENVPQNIHGFIASTETPSDLKIFGLSEKITIDLFVNGRLRDRNIINRISRSRIAESYLYGQIHFNNLDLGDTEDRFTTSREGVLENDPEYEKLTDCLRKTILPRILSTWDKFREEIGDDGDDEDLDESEKKARTLFNSVIKEWNLRKFENDKINAFISGKHFKKEAQLNFKAYSTLFVFENLLRYTIDEYNISIDQFADKAKKYRQDEKRIAKEAQLYMSIRKKDGDLFYLGISDLLTILENEVKKGSLVDNYPRAFLDEHRVKLSRNATMHTAILTKEVNDILQVSQKNILARIYKLINNLHN